MVQINLSVPFTVSGLPSAGNIREQNGNRPMNPAGTVSMKGCLITKHNIFLKKKLFRGGAIITYGR